MNSFLIFASRPKPAEGCFPHQLALKTWRAERADFKKAGGEPGVSGDSIIPISRLVLGRNELHGTSRMNSSCSHGRMFLCR